MKKVKYPNLDDYDLSAYEELKGDIDYAKAQLGKEGTSPAPGTTPANTPSANTRDIPITIKTWRSNLHGHRRIWHVIQKLGL